jgi:hypothetical protein
MSALAQIVPAALAAATPFVMVAPVILFAAAGASLLRAIARAS